MDSITELYNKCNRLQLSSTAIKECGVKIFTSEEYISGNENFKDLARDFYKLLLKAAQKRERLKI